jgi:hypothetical protein
MSDLPSEPPSSQRDDRWWRSALSMAAAAIAHAHLESTGRNADWPDAVMNASAGRSMGWSRDRWASVPPELAGVADAFAERLGREYNGEGRIPYRLDNDPALRNLREGMRRSDVDATLRTVASSIVETVDRTRSPDPAAVTQVRDAMSRTMLAVRDGRSSGTDQQDFGRRLGTAAADAGIRAMNSVVEERARQSLAQTVQHTLGASAQPAARQRTQDAGRVGCPAGHHHQGPRRLARGTRGLRGAAHRGRFRQVERQVQHPDRCPGRPGCRAFH